MQRHLVLDREPPHLAQLVQAERLAAELAVRHLEQDAARPRSDRREARTFSTSAGESGLSFAPTTSGVKPSSWRAASSSCRRRCDVACTMKDGRESLGMRSPAPRPTPPAYTQRAASCAHTPVGKKRADSLPNSLATSDSNDSSHAPRPYTSMASPSPPTSAAAAAFASPAERRAASSLAAAAALALSRFPLLRSCCAETSSLRRRAAASSPRVSPSASCASPAARCAFRCSCAAALAAACAACSCCSRTSRSRVRSSVSARSRPSSSTADSSRRVASPTLSLRRLTSASPAPAARSTFRTSAHASSASAALTSRSSASRRLASATSFEVEATRSASGAPRSSCFSSEVAMPLYSSLAASSRSRTMSALHAARKKSYRRFPPDVSRRKFAWTAWVRTAHGFSTCRLKCSASAATCLRVAATPLIL
mmetsp:Transcript_16063/g.52339  ORF Transcript_16063/g.52339 Transcript_16063/m.52339 type:complete len:425 (-) Transcript_16063:462-1736(-)